MKIQVTSDENRSFNKNVLIKQIADGIDDRENLTFHDPRPPIIVAMNYALAAPFSGPVHR